MKTALKQQRNKKYMLIFLLFLRRTQEPQQDEDWNSIFQITREKPWHQSWSFEDDLLISDDLQYCTIPDLRTYTNSPPVSISQSKTPNDHLRNKTACKSGWSNNPFLIKYSIRTQKCSPFYYFSLGLVVMINQDQHSSRSDIRGKDRYLISPGNNLICHEI